MARNNPSFFYMRDIYKSKLGNILIESYGEHIIKCEFTDYFVEQGTDEIIEKM